MIPLTEFVFRLRADLDEATKEHVDPLVAGEADDYPAYRAATGQISGLRKAREILDELVKRVNEGRDV